MLVDMDIAKIYAIFIEYSMGFCEDSCVEFRKYPTEFLYNILWIFMEY